MGNLTIRDLLRENGVQNGHREQIVLVDIAKILPDERNFYGLSGIEALARNIELVGLLDPIRLRPVERDGYYCIVSGHRRREALQLLVDEGKDSFRQVPSIVEQEAYSERRYR